MIRVVAIGLLCAFAAATSAAELADYSVADLLEPCMEGDNDSWWGAVAESECEQYIKGFTDAYLLSNAAKRDKICLPATGNRPDEVRWAFMRWAYDNFERRHMPAAEGLRESIRARFRCNR